MTLTIIIITAIVLLMMTFSVYIWTH